jgi:AcrR family transcriptional regulator
MSKAVQNSRPRRGRPRAYDPEVALARAMAAFWNAGYAATSLDDLGAATGMNRPSLYHAFGDKHALYRTLLKRYRAIARTGMKTALEEDLPLSESLRRVYRSALALYLPRETRARGCFWISTAVPQAVLDPEVRQDLNAGLKDIDHAFEARFRRAVKSGERRRGARPAALAKMASAALYSLAIRSRAGASRKELDTIVDAAVELLGGKS